MSSSTGGFAKFHLIQYNTVYFPFPSSLSTSIPISHFVLHHSHCIHWILMTAPGRNNSSQSCHCSPFCLLQEPCRILKLHCTLFCSSPEPRWYLSATICCTQHAGCGFSFHSKHPEQVNAVSEPTRLLLLTVSIP